MNEDCSNISYEPLAELSLKYENDIDYIYCLCSRVLVNSYKKNQVSSIPKIDEFQWADVNGTHISTTIKPGSSVAQNCHKKQEETVSCYYSTSQYSTDEHDNLSQPALESDSGAEVSVTSRDLEWERYWAQNGDRLVWESWITKYNNYIDPTFLNHGNQDLDKDEIKEDDSDNIESVSSISDSEETDKKLHVKFICEDDIKSQQQNEQILIEEEKKHKAQACTEPPILSVGDYDGEASVDDKPTDIKEYDDIFDEQFRLRTGSRSSGHSGHLTTTTDSMTNVTRITLSTSNSSSEDLSKIDSSLSPTSSATSYTEQWQQLWNEHFNDLYNTQYNAFVLRYKESDPLPSWEPVADILSNVLGDPEFDDDLEGEYGNALNQSVDGILATKISRVEISKTEKSPASKVLYKGPSNSIPNSEEANYSKDFTSFDEESNSIKKKTKEKSRRKNNRQLEYLLENSVSATIKKLIATKSAAADNSFVNELRNSEIISEDSVCNSDCSLRTTVPVSVENSTNGPVKPETVSDSDSELFGSPNIIISGVSSSKSDLRDKQSSFNDKENTSSIVNSATSESFTSSQEQQNPVIKKRNQKLQSNLNRMSHTCSLLGYEFVPSNDRSLAELHVNYLKSNIKQQNLALRMYSRKHTRFDDDGKPVLEKVKRFLETEGMDLVSSDLSSSSSKVSSKKVELKEGMKASVVKECNILVPPGTAGACHEEDHEFLRPVKSIERSKSIKRATPEEEELSSVDSTPCSSSSEYCDEDEKSRHVNKKLKKSRSTKKKVEKQKKQSWPVEIAENPKLRKFWIKRYHLFSKFDEGIKLDEESWYSVTPECMSKHISERCRCDLVIDAFCGAGGNTIQFARTCERVIAIDIDPLKIELARNNARVYGVEDRIEFIVGDFLKLAPTLVADVVFLSPPWGGLNYLKESCFDLDKILPPVGGRNLLEIARKISNNVCYYLPRNCNVDQLIPLSGEAYEVEVEQNILQKKLIAISLYFGELIHVED